MLAQIEISVVIPVFNGEAFIERAVRSALGQTLRDIEVIAVDDGSSDGTAAVLSRLAAEDSRLRVCGHNTNRGVSAARNTALRHATGDWLALLDADDWYAADRLERLLAVARRHGADIIADNMAQCPESAIESEEPYLRLHGKTALKLSSTQVVRAAGPFHDRKPTTLQPVFRRSFLEANGLRYSEPLRMAEDADLLFRCLDRTEGLLILPEPGYHRMLRANSLSYGASLDFQREAIKTWRRSVSAFAWTKPAMKAAVIRHLDLWDRTLRTRSVARAVKGGRPVKALAAICRDPLAAAYLFPLAIRSQNQGRFEPGAIGSGQ